MEKSEIWCNCLSCNSAAWLLEVLSSDKRYTAAIDCLCGHTSAFVISYPVGGKPEIVKNHLLADDEYICSKCFEIFEKGRSDEEALLAYKRQTGDEDATLDDTDVCCEDCFQKFIIPNLN